MKSVCLAILNYNGLHHLQHLLPTARAAVARYGKPCPIVLLDNRSTQDDPAWVAANYPDVEVVVAPENAFLFSYNTLLPQRQEEIVVLLNNDLRLDVDFMQPLLRHFAASDTFAVSARSYDWEGTRVTSGPSLFRTHHGWFYGSFDLERQYACYTLFSPGGYMAVDRQKFLALGGFDRLFHPAYSEDLDLCYRAWCRGWKSIYEPESVVYHREGGSWNDGDRGQSSRMILQTQFLFQWRNLRHPGLRLKRHLYLEWLLLRSYFTGDRRWREIHAEARLAWNRERQEALKRAPALIDLQQLQGLCGRPVAASAADDAAKF